MDENSMYSNFLDDNFMDDNFMDSHLDSPLEKRQVERFESAINSEQIEENSNQNNLDQDDTYSLIDRFHPIKERFTGNFIVENNKGLHTRPSAELAKMAMTFSSDIFLVVDSKKVNAKSPLEILTLTASRGTKVRVEAIGKDCKEAIEALIELARQNFKMHY